LSSLYAQVEFAVEIKRSILPEPVHSRIHLYASPCVQNADNLFQ